MKVLFHFMSDTGLQALKAAVLLGSCHTSQRSSGRSGWTCLRESLAPECKLLQSRWLRWWPAPPGDPPSGQPACGWGRHGVTDIMDRAWMWQFRILICFSLPSSTESRLYKADYIGLVVNICAKKIVWKKNLTCSDNSTRSESKEVETMMTLKYLFIEFVGKGHVSRIP